MKRIIAFLKGKKGTKKTRPILTREDLEKKAIEGAKKAVREYRGVFERLAEYDRT